MQVQKNPRLIRVHPRPIEIVHKQTLEVSRNSAPQFIESVPILCRGFFLQTAEFGITSESMLRVEVTAELTRVPQFDGKTG